MRCQKRRVSSASCESWHVSRSSVAASIASPASFAAKAKVPYTFLFAITLISFPAASGLSKTKPEPPCSVHDVGRCTYLVRRGTNGHCSGRILGSGRRGRGADKRLFWRARLASVVLPSDVTLRTPGFQVFESPVSAAGLADDVARVHRLPRDHYPTFRTQAQLTQALRSLIERDSGLGDVPSFRWRFSSTADELSGEGKGDTFLISHVASKPRQCG